MMAVQWRTFISVQALALFSALLLAMQEGYVSVMGIVSKVILFDEP
jgi:hypothetical protein